MTNIHNHDHGRALSQGNRQADAQFHADGASARGLGIAAMLTGGVMAAEIAGGQLSGSLALLAGAVHMATDFVSLSLAWQGMRLARLPADKRWSYGYGRVTVLAAFANGQAQFAVAGWICIEAWRRIRDPGEVLGGVMLWVAVAGLAVNIGAFFALRSGDRSSINIRAAGLHVAGDLLGSVAAIIAALVIMATGWMPIDPILSVLVALIILRSAYAAVRESAAILLEETPPHLSLGDVAQDLSNTVPGVADIHHLHASILSESVTMVTLHARMAPPAPRYADPRHQGSPAQGLRRDPRDRGGGASRLRRRLGRRPRHGKGRPGKGGPHPARSARRGAIVGVGHRLHPIGGATVQFLLHRDVDHLGVGAGAVPMHFAGGDAHHVAGHDLSHRLAQQLNAADARQHIQRLPQRMSVPVGAPARREPHTQQPRP